LGAFAGRAGAIGLAYEGFDYPIGSPLPGLAGGSGWGAPWIGSANMTAIPPTLQHPLGLPSTGIKMNNPTVGEAFRPFAGSGITNTTDDLWISFMQQRAAAGATNFVNLDPLGAPTPNIAINTDGGGTITMSIGGGVPLFAGVTAGTGITDLIVLHMTTFTGNTTVEMYVDSNLPGVSVVIPTSVSFGQFYFRTDPGVDMDEIRVGTTRADAVPAPAGAALLVGAGVAGLRRRR
jgi:hypothetical protein